ncbi:hypothetical protein BY996DRAFT_4579093, partial [Phakopsora pachyrhizi]
KTTLFSNPIARYVLIDSGNIPVNRTTKNNQLLFKGTFDILRLGECIALFPKGASYSQQKIICIKDGIRWEGFLLSHCLSNQQALCLSFIHRRPWSILKP